MKALHPVFSTECDLMLVFAPFHRLVVSMENIGIEYIAAFARARGFNVRIINGGLHGLSTEDVIELVTRSRYKVLGLSTIHWNLPSALRIAEAARKAHPAGHIILGGVEAALNAENILLGNSFVDSIGMGEGEITVSALLAALSEGKDWRELPGLAFREESRVKFSDPLPLIGMLDSLPHPARDDMAAVIEAGGPVSMSSSRGCFGRCSFCSVRSFYGLSPGPSWRGRSAASVVREIREIHEKYGATIFSFIDETVLGPGERGRRRLMEICREIGKSGMKISFFMTVRADQVETRLFRSLQEAGLKKVEIGIESMAPSQLRRYGKTAGTVQNRRALRILEKLGIGVELFMIPFDSELNSGELRKNLRFYRSRFNGSGKYTVTPLSLANYLYPYPGTGARKLYGKNGWLGAEEPIVGFRATDERIERVGRTVTAFAALFESGYPMSFAGFGNLWINSLPLPDAVYKRICEICDEFGKLAVRFAEWTLAVVFQTRRHTAAEVEAIVAGIREFVNSLAALRNEVVALTNEHGRTPEDGRCRIEDKFSEELYRLGKYKKKLLRKEMNNGAFDEDEASGQLVNLLIKEPWL